MAEIETVDDPEKTTQEAQEAFSAGYKEGAPETTQPAEPAAVETKPEPTGTAEPPAAEPEPQGPKIVQLTEEDYKLLRAAAEEAPALKQQISKAFGTIGTVQEQIGQLRGQRGRIKLNKEAFAKLSENFPELAADLFSGLEATEVDATPQPAPQAQPVDHAGITERVKADLLEDQKKSELKLLDHLVPDWVKIVGKPDEDNDFRKWFKAQPENYRSYVENSFSAQSTADCIKAFQQSQKKPAQGNPVQRDAARTDRLRGAIPPKGGGSAPAPAMPNLQDAFRSGYRGATG